MIIAERRFGCRSSAAGPTTRAGIASMAARCWRRRSTSTATSPAAICRRSSSIAYCIIYSKMEYCQTVDEIGHPAVREVLRVPERSTAAWRSITTRDLPARSGMGSSSAFTVGLLHALHALQGRMAGKQQLALESVHLEQEVLKETVGSQDQVLAAYGGLNHVQFHPERRDLGPAASRSRRERMRELNAHLMLFYTGIKRTAADDRRHVRQRHRRPPAAAADHEGPGRRKPRRAQQRAAIIAAFGELLHEAWQAKRSLSAQRVELGRGRSVRARAARRARSAASSPAPAAADSCCSSCRPSARTRTRASWTS